MNSITKLSIRNLCLLYLPLLIWAFFTWFRFEREAQLIAYPLSYLVLLNIYFFNFKVSRLIFIAGSSLIFFLLFLSSANDQFNLLFYLKIFWIILLGFQLDGLNKGFDIKTNLIVFKLSRFIRIFLSGSIILFLIQLFISPGSLGKAANIIKVTGGWFDANYFGAFCLLLFISLNELILILKKNNDKDFDLRLKKYLIDTLKYLIIGMIMSISFTSLFLLVLYSLRFYSKKIYTLILSFFIIFSILTYTFFGIQSITFLSKRFLIDEQEYNYRNLSTPELYFQFRIHSLRNRLIKAQDIIRYKNDKDYMATHNSFMTLLKNIKLDKIVDNYLLVIGSSIFLILSFIIIRISGIIIGLNYIILSAVLDTLFSGFSLSIPILCFIQSINLSMRKNIFRKDY